ncbi:protein split ends isoform X4 [Rhizophagus clarus]|uniref:Protein split ends isoform X4 n=1 Tax=Rhizophagus clarus TaxID=94130 RepID=A0A8H3M5R4_9GLOM|nr:protein split ends isoform X4 [Rhizophagus clarus]
MTKRRGVTEKDKATKAAKTTKTIRTYVANSSRDYNKERDERREEGSEHEQDNLHGQDVDIGEGNNRQDDDIERIILDMLPEQKERNIEKERRENEKKEMERRDKERREKERREKERREKERREKERRERDRREKDKEQEENENDESESEEEILVQFGAMTNQLQICNCGYTESSDPTDEEVNNFISHKLIEFSRKCFKIVWVETESTNIKEKVKELDVITEDLEIPSCSGRNIASSLKLHLFS